MLSSSGGIGPPVRRLSELVSRVKVAVGWASVHTLTHTQFSLTHSLFMCSYMRICFRLIITTIRYVSRLVRLA